MSSTTRTMAGFSHDGDGVRCAARDRRGNRLIARWQNKALRGRLKETEPHARPGSTHHLDITAHADRLTGNIATEG